MGVPNSVSQSTNFHHHPANSVSPSVSQFAHASMTAHAGSLTAHAGVLKEPVSNKKQSVAGNNKDAVASLARKRPTESVIKVRTSLNGHFF